MNIVLVGLMGSGKSTVGRVLAEMLSRHFVDTDTLIEERAGMPISAIFASQGEPGFRALESQVIAEVSARDGLVISTGGGAVLAQQNREALRQAGPVIWLEAPAEELLRRASGQEKSVRPLLAGPDPLGKLMELLETRTPAYALAATHRINTLGRTHRDVAAQIIEQVPETRQVAHVRVELGDRSYSIHIGAGILTRIGELIKQALPKAGRALIVSDQSVVRHYGAIVKASLEQAGIAAEVAAVPPGEASKSFAQAADLYTACVKAGLERSSVIVSLGGGVVGDLAGFVAATFLRGIAFVQVPTTLLSQSDASVGGKTAVDLPEGKNLVGAFHQPSLVLMDVNTLATLPRREVISGMAEVVKHGVIRDPAFLTYLESHAERIVALDPAVMIQVVERNCGIKAAVVATDEREDGLRAILNFGHTVGHAVEAIMGYGWLHGECVAVGMVAATAIAREAGVLQDASLPGRLETLLERLGLPTRLPPGVTLERMSPLISRDKKVEGSRVRWVLPVRAGEVTITADVPPEAVARAVAGLVTAGG